MAVVDRDPESVYRVVQFVATDPTSWERAAASCIAEIAKTVPDLRVAKVLQLDATVGAGKVEQYRVKLAVSYRIDRLRRTPAGATTTVKRCLVIVNRTVGDQLLTEALAERVSSGPVEFHVLVPTGISNWGVLAAASDPMTGFSAIDPNVIVNESYEDAARAAAIRLADQCRQLDDMGATVTGEVSPSDPMAAVAAVLERGSFDEILVSTLPASLSKWLRADLPSRLARRFGLPVVHVEAREKPAR